MPALPPSSGWSAVVAVLTVALAAAGALAQPRTYIALGDSVAWGASTTAENFQNLPNLADRGYVARVANFLGQQNGGVRPRLVNLAVPFESTTTYLTGSAVNPQANANYTDATAQSVRFGQVAQAELAAGRTVELVTLGLGANDLLSLADDPAFLMGTPEAQGALVLARLTTLQTNLAAIATQVRTTLPTTRLVIHGFYNPYAATPAHPVAPFAGGILDALNLVISGVADATGAEFADVAPLFAGREAELTLMLTDPPIGTNIHPTPAGYALIAQAIIPAPGAGAALVLLGAWSTRRRRAAA